MELQTIKISQCFESPTNPRGSKFEGKEFDELVASVTEKGVLMPILVRPQKGKFEVVAGNRRFRAAAKAGLTELPARVVEMTDIEAREAQIVENLQRADVHPLEEGAAYRDLIEKSGYDVEAVAVKVGKSESYVRNRLVLTNLIKAAQQAFRSDLMTATHAALVARLDEKKQKEALDFLDVDNDTQWREVPTAAELREWIQEATFTDSMANPPWSNDDEMKAALGGCDECKGKGGDLFGKKAADACTNPKCFANRMAAYIDIKLKADPNLVKLSGDYSSSEELLGSGHYHEISGKKDGCDHEEKGIIVDGRGIGRIIRFCRAPECKKHWSKQSPQGHYKPTKEELAARKKARQAEEKKKEKANAALAAALERIKWPLSENALDVLIDLVFSRFGYSYLQPVATRHDIKAVKKTQNGYTSRDLDTPLRKWVDAQGKDGKLRFVFEVALEMTDTAKFIKRL
jgi:ParB family transcriptional regulator, chromosome partitioning protein